MSDQGSTGGDIWVVNSNGKGDPTDVTPGIDGTPTWEVWVNDHTIGFVEDRRGHTLLTDVDADTHTIVPRLLRRPRRGQHLRRRPHQERRLRLQQRHSSPTSCPAYQQAARDLRRRTWPRPHQFTHLNDATQLHPPRFESIEWENEGFHVQGWLTFPKDYDASKKYPLIVEVHGGPSASAGPPPPSTMWSEQGYFVLNPNPRGCFGQGEKFTTANRKDFGYGDLRDILKGMDTIEAKYPIDKNREGITGWSYGGFMTMFAVTQTHRFRAAVAGAGLSDWQSYYGQNSIDQWMIPFFGASVYDDPAVYAKSSAITFIKKAKTPMLIIVGDRDGECPAPQSFEMWHALNDLGVKTQLVVYPDEGHGFRNPEHIRDRNERMIKWFADNMPATTTTQTAQKIEPAHPGASGDRKDGLRPVLSFIASDRAVISTGADSSVVRAAERPLSFRYADLGLQLLRSHRRTTDPLNHFSPSPYLPSTRPTPTLEARRFSDPAVAQMDRSA